MLDLLLRHSVQVHLHRYAVPLVQEVERGQGVLQREKSDELFVIIFLLEDYSCVVSYSQICFGH